MATRAGITIRIPGFGDRQLRAIVTDYTGTLSCGGRLAAGVRERLLALRDLLDLHVVTADSFGTAERELAGIVAPYHLREDRHDVEKENYVRQLRAAEVVALGNGNNDRLMLRAIKDGGGLAVAIDNGEGTALDALLASNLHIVGAANALDLLLDPIRCKATLRS